MGGFEGVPVSVYKVQAGEISEHVQLFGKIESRQSVTITSTVPGTVEKINFGNGDQVQKGDILFRLDNPDIRSSLDQARSSLAVAKANDRQVKSGTGEQEIKAMEQNVNSARVAYETAKTNFERLEVLYQSDAISLKQYEQAKAEMEMAQSKYESLKHQLVRMQNGPDQETLDVSRARVNQAYTAFMAAKRKAEELTITSPIQGYISHISVNEGESVNPGLPLATVDDLGRVKVDIDIPESMYPYFKVGLKTQVTVPTLNKTYEGTVAEIDTHANPHSGLFHVQVRLDNPNHDIFPGMTAEVRVQTEEKSDVLVIPVDAIWHDRGENYVFVVEDGLTIRKRIQTGIRSEKWVEVRSGLSQGEMVVVDGIHLVREGDRVQIISDINK
ncbi:MAG: efflux RND transporter periplasmic adaptor subunit [Bacillaceae bacterium]|nr:efflux RND transporter periplasmic adaptor subunit [Bacillaceae bacterium]